LGDQDGKGVDIATNEAINIKGNLKAISTPTFGAGNGGDVKITTPHLEVTGGGHVNTSSLGSGTGGNINVQVNQVTLASGGAMVSETLGMGAGGTIRVNARDSLILTGYFEGEYDFYGTLIKNYPSHIAADSFGRGRTGEIQITTHQLISDGGIISIDSLAGEANNITIEADSVTLRNGGVIASDTFGDYAGGDITLKVAGDLTIMGRKPTVMIFPPPFNVTIEAMQSTITSGALGNGAAGRITISANRLVMQEGGIGNSAAGGTGPAGRIQITVNELQLSQGGRIASNSGILLGKTLFLGTGDGGEVYVEVAGDLRIQGQDFLGVPSSISSNTLTTGRGGNITVRANHLQLRDGGLITANSLGLGNAGELTIQANTLEIFDQGQITTAAQYAGGGDIQVTTTNLLYLHKGYLTTSVMGGIGDGGNITIDSPQFVVLNHGNITAQADAGHGGNIRIVAEQFLKTPDSLISASSKLGIDGEIIIESLDETFSNNLFNLATDFIDVSRLLPQPCGKRGFETEVKRSKFILNFLAGSALSPHDFQPSLGFIRPTKTSAHPTASTRQNAPQSLTSFICKDNRDL
jgi:large exoprotein involved in heme utilization and adhesion